MRAGKQLMTASIVAVTVTLILSAVPRLEANMLNHRNEVAVFRPEPLSRIENGNLVDVLIGVPLKQPIKKVVWNHAVLSIDLAVGAEDSSAHITSDLLQMLQLAFIQTENVSRLLIRFLEYDSPRTIATTGSSGKLLLAADVRKSDRNLEGYLPFMNPKDMMEKEWRERLRLTYTEAWIERFGLPPQ
ncbi:hypothetical protein [Paenibacillus abyssi]|uniref:Uncharacterized protein n=1 Tax=Paenibacillus abyssi TaxID=1340531 RepID=A0A917CJU7_9BACL|nr:hypothetical protein [Paenibacillus abyssi]GGF88725.1 hypothetical protein GCM10010916_02530 [Paenibacillus abyssi]